MKYFIKAKRNLLILSLIVLGFNTSTQAQSCPPHNLILSTQNMVDSFPVLYPGCDNLIYGLSIMGTQINNLDSLYPIKRVGFKLIITNTTRLKSLHGLDNLDSVNGELAIRTNDSIWTLNGLQNLKYVRDDLKIISNLKLRNLRSLDKLNFVDNLRILYNPEMDSLVGIETLAQVGWGNGNLQVMNNASLKSLIGLENIVCENLQIWQNDTLETLLGLENNVKYDGLALQGNTALKNLHGLEGVDSLVGVLHIGASHRLKSLEPLDGLKYVGSSVSIAFCNSLKNLKGLDSLRSSGTFELHRLVRLKNLDHLNKLNTVNGQLKITENDSLWNLIGLDSIKTIASDLRVTENRRLKNLNGIETLWSIGEKLRLENDSILDDLTALRNVKYVGTEISIIRNSNLKSLSGIDSINAFAPSLYKLSIYRNPSLNICAVKSVCDFLPLTKIALIYDNALGCNDSVEVRLACQSISLEEKVANKELIVYPNPFSNGNLFIELDNTFQGLISFSLIDSNGKELFSKTKDFSPKMNLHLSDLPSGLYLLKVQDQNNIFKIQKILIQ